MTWHAPPELLDRYARGGTDDASALSIEAHLVSCDICRAAVATVVDDGRLAAIWTELVDVVDAPRLRPVERLARTVGVGSHTARLLAATPSLQVSWFFGIVLTLAFALAAAWSGPRGQVFFLAAAPLLPVAGVAAAFGPASDPTCEITAATPGAGFRLLLVRALAVLAMTTTLAGAAALALPGLDWTAAAWVLPALGLTSLSLAGATVVAPERAASAVAVLWVAATALAAYVTDDRLAAFRGNGQLLSALVAVLALCVIVGRREQFELRRSM